MGGEPDRPPDPPAPPPPIYYDSDGKSYSDVGTRDKAQKQIDFKRKCPATKEGLDPTKVKGARLKGAGGRPNVKSSLGGMSGSRSGVSI